MQQDSTLQTKLTVNSTSPLPAQPGSQSQLSLSGTNTSFEYQKPQIMMQQGPIFQNQLSLNQSPQVLVSSSQIDIINQNNTVKTLETRIRSDFCCYKCLLYWELLASIASVIFFICVDVAAAEIVITVLGSILMIAGCVFGLIAKASLDRKKQFIAFILFCNATLLSVLAAILSLVYIKHVESQYETIDGVETESKPLTSTVTSVFTIIAIPEQLIVGAALICNSHILSLLMRERDNLLLDISTKTNNAMISARF